jgi:hypothetical protein
MSFGAGDVVEGLAAKSSCLFVAGKADIDGAELDSGEFDGFVEKDIDQAPTTECAGMAIAWSTTWQESANHFEVVPDSSLGRQWVKCKLHPAVCHSPAKCVCPVRLAGDGYTP